ncbi:MAG: amylo-alpha-1,6-glucosidase [Microbacteriaceae bacterium]|nr:amylo-alpha-1,6-glucosidase [Microbacteriaceae bacterium]
MIPSATDQDASRPEHPPQRPEQPVQPLLHDGVIAYRAPTQVWSQPGGDLGAAAIDGIYHGDLRHVRICTLRCDEHAPEPIAVSRHGASRVAFEGLLRRIDDASADPKVRLRRDRRVSDGRVTEAVTVRSHLAAAIDTIVTLRVVPDFSPMQDIKAGLARARGWSVEESLDATSLTVRLATASFELRAPGARLDADGDALLASWPIRIAPFGSVELGWSIALDDPSLVVRGVPSDTDWIRPDAVGRVSDRRLARWLDTALGDLDALRLALPEHPRDVFYAAGAPWFFTLFGRDSIWTARLSLPFDREVAASTLRALASMQGTVDDPATAQQPGKIMHELRSAALELPGEGVRLPPIYYGTVDATALFVCLAVDAWRAGMPEHEVRALLPAVRRALDWLVHEGDGDGDGFIDYIDRTGHGLANQGWKDSGDSIQWRDGRLAEGPIALCEVQGYAYEAAHGAASLLDALGEPGGDGLREWAAALKARFAASYWVQTPEGRYPAIALDAHKRPVDSLTSNIGHLLGTGICSAEEEAQIARLLVTDAMRSGFGVRTMSTGAKGFWPLSYHGGSVWMHDSAIVARGMELAGRHDEALLVVEELLAVAEGFGYRVPELHSGEPAADTVTPVPYPAACRPQAWSAAAAVVCASILAA